ncbi:MAG: hypothetical protein DCC66_09375 [Planctomycetota bacterium]|nr:MAG: hypothetical protein DCC66_09375 [Planctomycetota bacterium]
MDDSAPIGTMETIGTRIVRCFHCKGLMKVSARALSVFCPSCQKRVNLEDLRITGTHPGKVLMTCGDILIEPTARLNVDVFGRRVVVHGRVVGQVQANESVEIASTGRVNGDIRAPKIIVQEGAVISGRCEMVRVDPLFGELRESGSSAHSDHSGSESADEKTSVPAGQGTSDPPVARGPAPRRLHRPTDPAV